MMSGNKSIILEKRKLALNKLFKLFMAFLYSILGIIVIACIAIVIYAKIGNNATGNEVSKELYVDNEKTNTSDGLHHSDEKDESSVAVNDKKNAESSEIVLQIDEQYALQKANSIVNPTNEMVLANDGETTIDGNEYYIINIIDGGDGTIYVSKRTGQAFEYADDIDEWIELEPQDPDEYEYVANDTGSNNSFIKDPIEQLAIKDGKVNFFGLNTDMTYQDAMNRVLANAGIDQNILSYDDEIYNTTAYNSTFEQYSVYDNVEISSTMGRYFFYDIPVRVNIKFDKPIYSAGQNITKEDILNANVIEIRMVAYRMQGNYNVETENGELVNTLSKSLGEPVEQDKYGMKYYYWSTDKSIVKALYDYEQSDNESDTTKLVLRYIRVREKTN